MILSNKSSKSFRFDRALATMLGGLILLFLLLVSGIFNQKQASLPENSIFCSAEKVRRGRFVHQGNKFSKGELKSKDRARTGNHSCKVEIGEGLQYGFGYQLDQPVAGNYYQVSVWQYSTAQERGKLVVEGKGADPFYLQSNQSVEKDNGWEKLQISFHVPFKKQLDHISIYVYTSGQEVIYFDDLLIEKKDAWAAASFQPEILQLKIDEQDLNKLERNRAEALQTGVMETDKLNWVEGEIQQASGTTIPVKLRLKGDWLDHLRGDKWSFRIKVKDPFTWKQLKTFSLHTPLARHYLHEWLLHQMWEKEDVLTTRYDFVELQLNGKTLGIYAYEEHFEKQLVESRQRREGPILKLAEDGFWAGIKRQLQGQGYVRPGATHSAMNKQNANIEAFQMANPEQFQEAQTLLHQFRYGLKPPAEVFDLELLARYYAICDVLNAYHGITWHNQRFYYNPITNKLEPVGFDGYGDKPAPQYDFLAAGALNPAHTAAHSIFNFLLLDPQFIEAYIKNLHRFSSRDYIDEFWEKRAEAIQGRLSYLQIEFPDYQLKKEDLITQNQYLHSLILPFEAESIKTYRDATNPQKIWLHNSHTLPLKIVGYGGNKKTPTTVLDSTVFLPGQTPRQIWNMLKKDSLIKNFNSIRFWEEVALQKQVAPLEVPLRLKLNTNYIFYQLPGIDSLFAAPISNAKKPFAQTGSQALFDNLSLESNQWFNIENNRLTFRQDSLTIDQNIVIPAGYEVMIEAGTHLNFIRHAALISKSPIQIMGTEAQPVKVFSSDQSSQGLSFLEVGKESRLKHVIFENLNNLSQQGWALSGAVNFYKSDVSIYRCVFRKNHCEDALNIIRSNFTIDQCHFNQTAFDAFDSDFSSGKVIDSYFVDLGNDAIDFSGSIVSVQNCNIKNPGDKGVSVGEESDISLFDTTIEGANLAMASKDLSMLYVRGVTLKDCEQGFAAYQKKPEYGGGKIVVESYEAENLRRLHAISEGSSLQLGDQLIDGSPLLQ